MSRPYSARRRSESSAWPDDGVNSRRSLRRHVPHSSTMTTPHHISQSHDARHFARDPYSNTTYHDDVDDDTHDDEPTAFYQRSSDHREQDDYHRRHHPHHRRGYGSVASELLPHHLRQPITRPEPLHHSELFKAFFRTSSRDVGGILQSATLAGGHGGGQTMLYVASHSFASVNGQQAYETQHRYCDSSGTDRASLERGLNDRAVRHVKQKFAGGHAEMATHTRNLRLDDVSEFEREWAQRVSSTRPFAARTSQRAQGSTRFDVPAAGGSRNTLPDDAVLHRSRGDRRQRGVSRLLAPRPSRQEGDWV
eukprot:m.16971 g.16971  ORF g.16971 m.16971 type:complete len:308 (-) comp5364_c0_seq1:291-1214(-)